MVGTTRWRLKKLNAIPSLVVVLVVTRGPPLPVECRHLYKTKADYTTATSL